MGLFGAEKENTEASWEQKKNRDVPGVGIDTQAVALAANAQEVLILLVLIPAHPLVAYEVVLAAAAHALGLVAAAAVGEVAVASRELAARSPGRRENRKEKKRKRKRKEGGGICC
jgi:hypothetical protein